jgi:hypothetical protein
MVIVDFLFPNYYFRFRFAIPGGYYCGPESPRVASSMLMPQSGG